MKSALFEMKSASAPGPNGFGVQFFKSFWPIIKGDYMALFEDLHKRVLDVRRLNYGVITLVQKCKMPTLSNNMSLKRGLQRHY